MYRDEQGFEYLFRNGVGRTKDLIGREVFFLL